MDSVQEEQVPQPSQEEPREESPSPGSGPGLVEAPAPEAKRTAAEICRDVPLGFRAKRLLVVDMKPGQFLADLVAHRLYTDAIRYMAVALLNREAIWWSCLCVRSEFEMLQTLPDAERQALGAAVRWVLEPSEALRQAAGQLARAAGTTTPAGSAARAASYALGQTDAPGPRDLPLMPIQAARLAASGVMLAAARGPTGDVRGKMRRFITLGLDVAYGINRWD